MDTISLNESVGLILTAGALVVAIVGLNEVPATTMVRSFAAVGGAP